MPALPQTLLLVDDNPGDVESIRLAFEEANLLSGRTMLVARNGPDALKLLRKQGIYSDANRPDLILLDLNLPGLDGREVLRIIKTDADLKRIPVMVLTSSDAEQDVATSYELHANSYLKKPVHLEELEELVKAIDSFWFSVVTYAEVPAA